MLKPRQRKQRGFTLVEILIALLLGSLLLTMIVQLYSTNVAGQIQVLKTARVRMDLQSVMRVIESDLRRAGYGGNDFLVGEKHNKVIDIFNNGAQQCIVYAYNDDKGTTFNTSYVMGIRYSTKTQSIQFGRKVSTQAKACFTTGFWTNLTDPHFMQVVKVAFSERAQVVDDNIQRNVDIELVARQADKPNALYQLHSFIHVRNNEVALKQSLTP